MNDDIQKLNEAIEHCKEIINTVCNKECRADHIQLLNWLEELKRFKEEK